MKAISSVKPFDPGKVRLLDGFFKERQDVHTRFLKMVEPDRLLAPFRLQAGLPVKAERYGGWESRDVSGHSLGHYLSALSYLYAATGDDEARTRVGYIVDELAACQQANADGYVLPVNKKAFDDLRQGKIDVSPFSLNGVWVPFYTQHKVLAGLRDAYRLVDNPKALEIERQIANWIEGALCKLGAGQIQEMLRAEHGGMNEVLTDLAADTGDDRYLGMAARFFHHAVVLDPMLRGEDKLNGLHGNTQIPKVVGLAREYEETANPAYRLAADSFWDHVVNHRSYANGGHGESEHFFPLEQFPKRLTPNTCETCNTYNMLKLTGHIFSWEPKAEKMDFVERAMINHLAANIGRQPGEFGYFLGLGSVGVKAFSTPFDSWWCCVGTGMENPVRYAEQVYYHDADSLWVNLFIASQVEWAQKGIVLRQETKFPDGDKVRLVISCAKPVSLAIKLRHPYWCANMEVRINGKTVSVASSPSSYLTLHQAWTDGDTIDLSLPMALRLEPLPHSNGKISAIMYGPLVLAALVPDEPGVLNPAKQRFSEHLNSRGKTDAFPPLLVANSEKEVLENLKPTGRAFAEFSSQGILKPNDLAFVPFHRVYEEQYAIYFSQLSPDDWVRREGEIRADRAERLAREAATFDTLTPGYQQPEIEHSFSGEKSEVEDFSDRKGRMASDGGWFSYVMAVDPVQPATLLVTYWGGVWNKRQFDLLIEGQVIGTQELLTNKPGDFFEEAYAIPPDLTAGKRKVTVRFESHPDDAAGTVFGLCMMRTDAAPARGFDLPHIVFKDH